MPLQVNELKKALELDAHNNWGEAHRIVQHLSSTEACWIHAYLHRKEGDRGNAAYWYSRANKPFPSKSLKDEWSAIMLYLESSK